jgi:hypothetical protein
MRTRVGIVRLHYVENVDVSRIMARSQKIYGLISSTKLEKIILRAQDIQCLRRPGGSSQRTRCPLERLILGCMKKGVQTPIAQGRSTKTSCRCGGLGSVKELSLSAPGGHCH